MKKILLMLLVVALFSACGDDEDDVIVGKLELSLSNCELSPEKTFVMIDIVKGAGDYKAKSSNESVAIAAIDNNKLYVIGANVGKATITVTDKDGNNATVAVVINRAINQLIPTAELVLVKKGTVKKLAFPFDEAIPFRLASEDEKIATAVRKNDEVEISGVAIGETKIHIVDMIYVRHSYDVKVVDTYELGVGGQTSSGRVGEDIYFHIFTGNGGYTITSSNEAVATAEIIPFTVTQMSGVYSNPVTVKVKALTAGNVTFTIKDKENKTKTVSLNIYP